MANSTDNFLVITKKNKAGYITINNPATLNALTAEMVLLLTTTLKTWATDDTVTFIVIDSSSSKAFSSGGDLKAVYNSWKTADTTSSYINYVSPFFAQQYQLDYLIATYKKPIISLVEGICMGAGMGIAMHSTYQVVTDGSIMSMPEAAIGFFPDAGAAYFLQNCAKSMGLFLGLSGWRLTASQAFQLNLATHYVDSTKWKEFASALEKTTSLESTLDKYMSSPPEDAELLPYIPQIQRCLIGENLCITLELLKISNIPLCQELYRRILSFSPTSLLVWQYHYQQSFGMPLKEILKYDYRVAQNFLHTHDLYEGIRSVIIDKSSSPKWKPNVLEDISKEEIGKFYNTDSADIVL